MTSGEGLAAGDVARRLGISVTTLRTWHQRYGLGPSEHARRQHRRYTEQDLARLETMRRLTGLGVSAAEAARVALAQPAPVALAQPAAAASVRAGGGNTIAVGRAGPAARGLARAAMRLDRQALVESMTGEIRAGGVVHAWDGVIAPVLVGIGERHAATQRLVEVEHLLSRTVSDVLAAVASAADHRPARILLACADEEQHSLPLEALAAALAERGYGSRLLGARVPPEALLAAVKRTGPAAVVVWSHARTTADPAQVLALLNLRPRPPVVAAAGPGWAELPPGIERPSDLTSALALLIPASTPAGTDPATPARSR